MDINKLDSIGPPDSRSAQQRAAQTEAEKRQERVPASDQPAQQKVEANAIRGGTSTDTVQLSDAARTLSTKAQDTSDEAGIDHQHLESIRQAIAEGRYHIDGQRLAEQILRLENEIYGS